MKKSKPSRRQQSSRDNHAPGKDRGGSFRQRFGPRNQAGQPPREKSPPLPPEALARTREALDKWLPSSLTPQAKPQPAATSVSSEGRSLSELITLDPWQREALEALRRGESVIVDAPTTAGKTRIIEAFFQEHLKREGFRAAYTTPVKSLSNDKLREFRDLFGTEYVGIATGDIKENLQAPIVVATLETYRNSLLGMEPDLGRTLVVFDEYHYLQDEGRGSAWEEAIMLTPPNCQLLLLSASVDNPGEFAAWLKHIRGKDCHLIRTTHRPVPLEPLVWYAGHWVLPSTLPKTVLGDSSPPKEGFQLNKPPRKRPHEDNPPSRARPIPPEPEVIAQRLISTIPLRLTPCIVYAGRRLSCENLAVEIARAVPYLPDAERRATEEALRAADERFGAGNFLRKELRRMITEKGVAFHHSGLATQARLVVETLLKRGQLRFCAATMGLSLGVNFAVRSAVMTDYSRPGDSGFTEYGPSEVLQMLGRAGRRGQDKVGFSLWADAAMFRRFGKAHREPCESKLRNDPATFLGLVARDFSLDDIERFYERSFRHFRRQTRDLKIISPTHLRAALKTSDLPCASPAGAFTSFLIGENRPTPCAQCRLRKDCHHLLKKSGEGALAALQMHLHAIKALDDEGRLTPFGSTARFLPQFGGLLLARMMTDGRLHDRNPLAAAELMGALSLAAHKDPSDNNDTPSRKTDEPTLSNYQLPFNETDLREELEELYPEELFPEVYELSRDRRRVEGLRDFNTAGGFIASEWGRGAPWPQMSTRCTSRYFGAGDLMNLLLRVSTYMHSVSQAAPEPMKLSLSALRREWLRDPLATASF